MSLGNSPLRGGMKFLLGSADTEPPWENIPLPLPGSLRLFTASLSRMKVGYLVTMAQREKGEACLHVGAKGNKWWIPIRCTVRP